MKVALAVCPGNSPAHVGMGFAGSVTLGVRIREIGPRQSMLSLSKIEKTFGATRALKSVSLEAAGGTVLGLAGENGAGKSTLIKIVSGAVVPGQGSVTLDGKQIAPRNTNDAIALGISSVFQELTLVRELSVERNLLLTSAPTHAWGSISRKRARQATDEILSRHRLDVDPDASVGDLPLGRRQMLEIVRAVERNPRVLLLDEATSALGDNEVAWLAERVRSPARFRRDRPFHLPPLGRNRPLLQSRGHIEERRSCVDRRHRGRLGGRSDPVDDWAGGR